MDKRGIKEVKYNMNESLLLYIAWIIIMLDCMGLLYIVYTSYKYTRS